MNDSEAIMEIQATKDIYDDAEEMKSPQDFPPRVRLGNNDENEEHQPFQDLPDIMIKQEREEYFEVIPIEQNDQLTGPQIVHEFFHCCCCIIYKRIKRIKKKEDNKAGKPNKITRLIDAKEVLLVEEPPSDELYFWSLKASLWVLISFCAFLFCCNLFNTFYSLFTGKLKAEFFWAKLGVDLLVGVVFAGLTLWQKRTVRNALIKNDLLEAKKQFKRIFGFPFIAGLLVCYLQATAP